MYRWERWEFEEAQMEKSFHFVTEKTPGVTEGVKTHRCKHREEEWYRHMAGGSWQGMCFCRADTWGRTCRKGLGEDFSTSSWCPPVGTELSVQGWLKTQWCFQMTDANCSCHSSALKNVTPLLGLLNQALLSEVCVGLDQLSHLVPLLILKLLSHHFAKRCLLLGT